MSRQNKNMNTASQSSLIQYSPMTIQAAPSNQNLIGNPRQQAASQMKNNVAGVQGRITGDFISTTNMIERTPESQNQKRRGDFQSAAAYMMESSIRGTKIIQASPQTHLIKPMLMMMPGGGDHNANSGEVVLRHAS